MDNLIYYFHENNIETATTEINVQGWQRFTEQETERYLRNTTLLPYWNGSNYELIEHIPPIFDLATYKSMKLGDMSDLSLMIKEQKYPYYRYQNAVSSLNMISRGEDPIYSQTQSDSIIQEYDNKFKLFRNEYYRLKSLIDISETVEEIDNICFNNQFDMI